MKKCGEEEDDNLGSESVCASGPQWQIYMTVERERRTGKCKRWRGRESYQSCGKVTEKGHVYEYTDTWGYEYT